MRVIYFLKFNARCVFYSISVYCERQKIIIKLNVDLFENPSISVRWYALALKEINHMENNLITTLLPFQKALYIFKSHSHSKLYGCVINDIISERRSVIDLIDNLLTQFASSFHYFMIYYQ